MRHLLVFWFLVLVGGCTSIGNWMEEAPRPVVKEMPDGPPLLPSVNVFEIPEPEPMPEPIAAYGNPKNYEVNDVTYEITSVETGFKEMGIASWYGRKFHGRLTSSGEQFDMFKFTGAHKTMPIPAWIRVTNLENNLSLIIRINDRGPFKENRVLDLSWAAAKRLKFADKGTTKVRYEVLEIPQYGTSLRANPLVDTVQQIFQVTAVSSEYQANMVAEKLSEQFSENDASVRVQSNNQGMFRVQVLPRADQDVMKRIFDRLVMLGWSPQRLIAR